MMYYISKSKSARKLLLFMMMEEYSYTLPFYSIAKILKTEIHNVYYVARGFQSEYKLEVRKLPLLA